MISCGIRTELQSREISRNDEKIKSSTSFRVFPRMSCALAKEYAKYEGGGQQQQMDDQCATKCQLPPISAISLNRQSSEPYN